MKLINRIFYAGKGEPISAENFCKGQMQLDEIKVLMALEYVKSRKGAERIYKAELSGIKRPLVIQRAIRRMEDFDSVNIPKGEAQGGTQ